MGKLNADGKLREIWLIFYQLQTSLGITHPPFPAFLSVWFFGWLWVTTNYRCITPFGLTIKTEFWVERPRPRLLSVWFPKRFAVDKISIKFQLPIFEAPRVKEIKLEQGLKWTTSWENLFLPYVNNKGTDQSAHPHSLISAFVVCYLDSIMSLVSISEISRL